LAGYNLDAMALYRLRIVWANESIKGENIEILQWLLPEISSGHNIDWSINGTEFWRAFREKVKFMHLGANAESVDVFEAWKTYLGTYLSRDVPMITDEAVLQKVKDPVKQDRLASTLSEQASLGHLTSDHLSRALKAVASTTCSVSIARVLLDNGADVDFRSSKMVNSWQIKTPLIAAAAKRTREGADMMKLLLLAGADPTACYQPKKDSEPRTAGMEPGAKNISKWLGLTWDELVEWAVEQRSQNLQGGFSPRLSS
jgi:hypothetical protein